MLGDYRESVRTGFDELVTADGVPRPGWEALSLETWDAEGLRAARGLATRLLEDDGVTYNLPPDGLPEPRGDAAAGRRPNRWRLDPLPTMLAADEWAGLERGVAQRHLLLEQVLADLYGERRLLTSGLVPPELVWRHDGYVRSAWGTQPAGRPRIVLGATDVGRGATGAWHVIADRTQAPSGLGYAMENRRVVTRLLPDAYRGAGLRRLTGFFGQVRDTLVDLAAPGIEDPRVVVLTPGRHSETAFDQAYIASLLGLPLVTGADLVMREGRLWTRDLEGRRPVDVVLRRVDDTWCDPLELRPDSELGVPGLVEACRRGTVVAANGFGSGLVESPAFHPLLPRLCEALLDEPLLLPSTEAWWCGDPGGLAQVLAHLDALVVRPVSTARGRGVYVPGLSEEQRARLADRIRADPGSYVGQAVLPLSTTPTVAGFGLGARPLTLRVFSVAREDGYAVMPGALGRIVPDSFDPATGRRDRVALSKDVWVLKAPGRSGAGAGAPTVLPEYVAARPTAAPAVPRALENLYWMGRYTERAESATRHVLALRSLVDEVPFAMLDPGRGAVDVLARALTHVTGTYPGFAGSVGLRDAEIDAELRELLVAPGRVGAVAHSLEALAGAAGSVRDQLSADVFTVLGAVDRACASLRDEVHHDVGSAVLETGVHVLSGTLALAGITSENMVRDVGWRLLDIGRGLERALQTTALVQRVLGDAHPPAVERHLVAAVLTAGESVLTHRRRYAGSEAVETMLHLMLLDDGNPRSVAFQVDRLRRALAALPGGPAVTRLRTLVEELGTALTSRSAAQLAAPHPVLVDSEVLFAERRTALVLTCDRLTVLLRDLSEAFTAAYFPHPSAPRPLGSAWPRLEASG